jgi:serine phosphatase RsbU (regulator of sigma subunit)
MKMISFLTRDIAPDRYLLLMRGLLLVFAGYSIATVETVIAIGAGLTPITYSETMFISVSVLSVSIILILAVYYRRKLTVWQEWTVFGLHLLIYLGFYCLWVYRLGDLRLLGLISTLIAVTIVISYTNLVQSLLMSISTVVCHFSVTWYAITVAHQPGLLARELFLSVCLLPAFILISVAAYHITRQRSEFHRAKIDLEKVNRDLNDLNTALRREQAISEIEMDLAHDIQSAFFPARPPLTRDWDIAFVSRPCSGISGDFYDFYCSEGTLNGISLFDVSGHGVAPALITILSKPILYRHFKNGSDDPLGGILEATNRDLFEQLEEVNIYITGILLRMKEHEVEYVNAGHPELLHLRAEDGSVAAAGDHTRRHKGNPVGISTSSRYETMRFQVGTGDLLLLFSDCMIECRNCMGEQYGIERLMRSVAEAPRASARAALDHVLEGFHSFVNGTPLSDDLTMIVAMKT